MRYLTILFDFDGTLADSTDLSLDVINALAPEFGYAPIARAELPNLKRMSARELLVRRAGIPLWNILKIRRLERTARTEFAKRRDEIRVFSGIPELMRGLRGQGYEIGVVSSNAAETVARVLSKAGISADFIHADSRFFGKARAIRNALGEYAINVSRAVYIGDELRDVEACKKVGIDMIAVGWGFNDAEALSRAGVAVAATPEELLGILAGH